jgi:hypothetical protein
MGRLCWVGLVLLGWSWDAAGLDWEGVDYWELAPGPGVVGFLFLGVWYRGRAGGFLRVAWRERIVVLSVYSTGIACLGGASRKQISFLYDCYWQGV